jgi:hypothetical protein
VRTKGASNSLGYQKQKLRANTHKASLIDRTRHIHTNILIAGIEKQKEAKAGKLKKCT